MMRRMGYYWTYYAAVLLAAYAVHNPWACGVAVLFFAVRRWLPDPVILMRSLSRIGALKTQTRLNPGNAVARRDLGRAYLDLRRPRTALRFLDEAAEREPRDADVAYLRGQALLRLGDDERALRAFAVAVGFDPDENQPFSDASKRGKGLSAQRHADAYLAAAIALERLGRIDQSEEAYMMAASSNSSNLEPLVRLARLRRRKKDEPGAEKALAEARETWSALPGFMRRKQFGWRVRAMIA